MTDTYFVGNNTDVQPDRAFADCDAALRYYRKLAPGPRAGNRYSAHMRTACAKCGGTVYLTSVGTPGQGFYCPCGTVEGV